MKAVVFTNSLDREDKLTVIRDVGGPLVKSSGARLSECQLCFAPRSVTRCRDVVKSVDASDLELSSVICHKHGSRENCGKANLARNVNNFVLSPICNTA